VAPALSASTRRSAWRWRGTASQAPAAGRLGAWGEGGEWEEWARGVALSRTRCAQVYGHGQPRRDCLDVLSVSLRPLGCAPAGAARSGVELSARAVIAARMRGAFWCVVTARRRRVLPEHAGAPRNHARTKVSDGALERFGVRARAADRRDGVLQDDGRVASIEGIKGSREHAVICVHAREVHALDARALQEVVEARLKKCRILELGVESFAPAVDSVPRGAQLVRERRAWSPRVPHIGVDRGKCRLFGRLDPEARIDDELKRRRIMSAGGAAVEECADRSKRLHAPVPHGAHLLHARVDDHERRAHSRDRLGK